MNKAIAVIVGLIVLSLLLLFSSTFTVKYNEIGIKTRFGKADESSIVSEPGLGFKLPIFHKVAQLDKRIQLIEAPTEEITTADGLQIVVKAFLLWRIDTETPGGPLEFYRDYESTTGAAAPISGRFRTAFTGVLSEYRFDELIGGNSKLAEAEQNITQRVAATLAADGVKAVSSGISRIMLPTKSAMAVVERMQAERQALASRESDKGTAEATRIHNEANTKSDAIRAFSEQFAAEIRAEGAAQAEEYLADLRQDEDLAIFLEWIDALKASLSRYTTIILPMNQAPFHLMNPALRSAGANGIPMPAPPRAPDESDESQAAVDGNE